MTLVPNRTPWVDRNVAKFMQAMLEVVPDKSWLPQFEAPGSVEELGCGHYGCVMPTGRDDTVFKITSDPAEAAFVRVAIELAERDKMWPAGMVQYKAIYQLAGASYRRRPVFIIWRQEAFDIGFLVGAAAGPGVSYGESVMLKEAQNYIGNTKIAGHFVREYLAKDAGQRVVKVHREEGWARGVVGEHFDLIGKIPMMGGPRGGLLQTVDSVIRRYRGAERAAVALAFYSNALDMMEHNNPLTTNIGHAMNYYFDQGIVLADVHLNNIGKAHHEDFDELIPTITDPGHAVFLDDRFDGLTVEEMEV